MSSSAWAAIWTLAAGVFAAVAASIGNLVVNRRMARLQSQLDFVNTQLRDFYGPLLAITEALEQAWVIFRDNYKSDAGGERFWNPVHPPTLEARAIYQHWAEVIFLPLNDRLAEIVSSRIDLVIEQGIPQCLTDLYAHVLTRKAALVTWNVESGRPPDSSEFPTEEVLPYLEASFAALKIEQGKLLKAITGTREHPLTQGQSSIPLMSVGWRDARLRKSSPSRDETVK